MDRKKYENWIEVKMVSKVGVKSKDRSVGISNKKKQIGSMSSFFNNRCMLGGEREE